MCKGLGFKQEDKDIKNLQEVKFSREQRWTRM
jgi:hypothetical protein